MYLPCDFSNAESLEVALSATKTSEGSPAGKTAPEAFKLRRPTSPVRRTPFHAVTAPGIKLQTKSSRLADLIDEHTP